MPLHFEGILVGAAALLLIGIFHPIVIWCEYYFSKKIWPAFFTAGAGSLIASLLAEGLCSLFLGVLGVTCLWSIKEILDLSSKGNHKSTSSRRARSR